jgi:hypothetical protein
MHDFVERIDLEADASSVEFTGLDGDKDNTYALRAMLKSSDAVTQREVDLQPNGIDTDQSSILITSDGTGPYPLAVPRAAIGWLQPGGQTHLELTFKATKKDGLARFGESRERRIAGTGGVSQASILGFAWTDTTTKVTSLKIVGPFAAGSSFTLYKMPLG